MRYRGYFAQIWPKRFVWSSLGGSLRPKVCYCSWKFSQPSRSNLKTSNNHSHQVLLSPWGILRTAKSWAKLSCTEACGNTMMKWPQTFIWAISLVPSNEKFNENKFEKTMMSKNVKGNKMDPVKCQRLNNHDTILAALLCPRLIEEGWTLKPAVST